MALIDSLQKFIDVTARRFQASEIDDYELLESWTLSIDDNVRFPTDSIKSSWNWLRPRCNFFSVPNVLFPRGNILRSIGNYKSNVITL